VISKACTGRAMAVLSVARPIQSPRKLREPDALAFLFGKPVHLAQANSRRVPCEEIGDSQVEEAKESSTCPTLAKSPTFARELDPGPLDWRCLAALMPAAAASHAGLLTGSVALACVPIAVPFSVPQVAADSWLANKRARAFHRGVVISVCAQGVLTLLKLSRGDLVGGLYDGVLTAIGSYAVQTEGIRFFPTYIICCGFNGLLGLLQIMQGYQGIPLHMLPWLAVLPPSIALFGAYCGWQFCKEVSAISAGHTGAGPQDTCFVRVMGADWWPSFLGPQVATREERFTQWGRPGGSVSGQGGGRDQFSAFGGDGHRLGEN